MKNLIITATLFISLSSTIQSQSTAELFSLNELYFALSINTSPGSIPGTMFYNGETDVCGDIVFQYGPYYDEDMFLMRVTNGLVEIGTDCGSLEVAFDFDLQVNDTIRPFGSPTYKVISRESVILLDGLSRTELELVSQDSQQDTVRWIEGIGDVLRGPFDIMRYGDHGEELLCAGNGDMSIHLAPNFSAADCESRGCRPAQFFVDAMSDEEQFYANATTRYGDSLIWKFGDGQTDTGEDITHEYDEEGCYIITVYAVPNCNSNVDSLLLFHNYCQPVYWTSKSDSTINTAYQIDFASADNGYLLTATDLYKSSDGGNNWATVSTPLTGDEYRLSAISVLDEDKILLACIRDDMDILSTVDGGDSWASTNLGQDIKTIEAFENGHCFASSQEHPEFYYSSDFGQTWTQKNSPSQIRWVRFIDVGDGTFAALGYRGDFYTGVAIIGFTNDFGDSWDFKYLYDYRQVDFSALHFTDATNGVLVGHGFSLATTDGGNTWMRQEFPRYEYIRAATFVDDLNGWAVGDHLWVTADGGETWDVQMCVDAKNLLDISGIDAEHAYALEFGGQLFSFDATATSDCISATSQPSVQSTPLVYPNPTSNTITIEVDRATSGTVAIYSIDGVELHRSSVSSTDHTVDMNHFPKGIYILNFLETDGQLSRTKVMKL